MDKHTFNAVLRKYFRLSWRGHHGAPHWARVCINAKILAQKEGANTKVAHYFGLFHDMARASEYTDDGHGLRSATLLKSLGGADFLKLTDDEFAELCDAMALHSDHQPTGTITQKVCWDADRLDLWRIGIMPDPDRLFTESARQLHFERLGNGYY